MTQELNLPVKHHAYAIVVRPLARFAVFAMSIASASILVGLLTNRGSFHSLWVVPAAVCVGAISATVVSHTVASRVGEWSNLKAGLVTLFCVCCMLGMFVLAWPLFLLSHRVFGGFLIVFIVAAISSLGVMLPLQRMLRLRAKEEALRLAQKKEK